MKESPFIMKKMGGPFGSNPLRGTKNLPQLLSTKLSLCRSKLTIFRYWDHHKKFGGQFKAENRKKASSVAALEKYLGSGLIKGVGPKTAKKIVSHFGNQTLNIFEGSIDELMSVPGIARAKLSTIKKSWQDHRAIRDVMLFLQQYDISTLFAVKIYKAYGEEAITKVKKPLLSC